MGRCLRIRDVKVEEQDEEGKFDVQVLTLEFMAAGVLMLGEAVWPEMGRSGKKLSKLLSNIKDHNT